MKCFLPFVFFLSAQSIKAQNIEFNDFNFKEFLLNYSPAIDTNNDGEIQVAEALAVHKLRLEVSIQDDIRSTDGLNAFKNLDTLYHRTFAATLDLSGLDKLKFLDLNNDYFLSYLVDPPLHQLALNGCSALESLNTTATNLTSLDMTGCSSLRYANFAGVNIQNFNPGLLDSLKLIFMGHSGYYFFDTLDFRGCRNLERFESDARFQHVNFSGLRQLTYCSVSGFDENDILTSVNLSGCEKLPRLGITSSWIKTLNVNGCKSLKFMSLQVGELTDLDLSTCIKLDTLRLSNLTPRSKLKYLNLKNGKPLTSFYMEAADSTMICTDDFEVDYVAANLYPVLPSQPNPFVFISPYCSTLPGGNYNSIAGTVRVDANNNGCDSTDAPARVLSVKITDTANRSYYNYTNTAGSYAYYTPKGIFTIAPEQPGSYFSVAPASAVVSFDTANDLTSFNNFCLRPSGVHNDVEIAILPSWPPARPGFEAGYTLIYKNKGNTTLSGNVQLNYDAGKLTFVNSATTVSTQTAGQLTWNYNNLLPFESRSIYATLSLLPPPVNNNDDTLFFQSAIIPLAGDETPANNSVALQQIVRGSFDPNDKQCLQGDKIDIGAIGEPLDYLIRFQNLGTDTAFNIVVADTLSNKFDWNSFEFTASSHPCSVTRKDNKLEFVFNNIQLPYKAINEPASNGFVAYKIKPASTVVLGDSLNNKASIYFDFNFPVVTNLATTIVSNVSTPVAIKLEYFTARMNGLSNVLRWKASCTSDAPSFVIERSADGYHFAAIGNMLTNTDRCRLPYQFTDNNPFKTKNYYRIKMTDASGDASYSKIILLSGSTAGFSITAVAGNNVYFSSEKAQKVTIRLLAADGKLLYNNSNNLPEGDGQFNLPINSLPVGVYTLLLVSNDGVVTRKFVR